MSFIKIDDFWYRREFITQFGPRACGGCIFYVKGGEDVEFTGMPIAELEAIIFGPDHVPAPPAAPKQDSTRSDGDLRLLDSLKGVDPMLAAGFERLLDTESRLIDVVFDGPPSHESGRFVELEVDGFSVGAGEWVQRGDEWLLRLSLKEIKAAFGMVDRQREALKAEGKA